MAIDADLHADLAALGIEFDGRDLTDGDSGFADGRARGDARCFGKEEIVAGLVGEEIGRAAEENDEAGEDGQRPRDEYPQFESQPPLGHDSLGRALGFPLYRQFRIRSSICCSSA